LLEEWLSEINTKNDTQELVWQSRVDTVESEKRQLIGRIMQLENDVCMSSHFTLTVYILAAFSTSLLHLMTGMGLV